MIAILLGDFDESASYDAGHVDESDYCEGARDARQLLADRPAARRLAHGSSVD
jgi:hypothetical protein